jgi:glycosyltransferase involved in cell wall biosynthesis
MAALVEPRCRSYRITETEQGIASFPDAACQRALAECLQRQHYDVIVARYLPSLLRIDSAGTLPIVLDIDDVPGILERPSSTGCVDAAASEHHFRARQLVIATLKRCAGLWVCNPSDVHIPYLGTAAVLPNIPFTVARRVTPPPSTPTMLFVGALKRSLVVESLDSFIVSALPIIRSQVPEAQLRIAGYGASPALLARWNAVDGVKCVGYVDDLAPLYRACAFTVVPLKMDRGTHIKIVESCAHGRTCIVSAAAHRGYERDLADGEAVRVGLTMFDMAQACVELLQDHERNRALAARSWAIVQDVYTFSVFANAVSAVILRALSTTTFAVRHPR